MNDEERATRARASAALHNVVTAAATSHDDVTVQHEARVLRLLEQLRAHCDQLRPTGANDDLPIFVPGLLASRVLVTDVSNNRVLTFAAMLQCCPAKSVLLPAKSCKRVSMKLRLWIAKYSLRGSA